MSDVFIYYVQQCIQLYNIWNRRSKFCIVVMFETTTYLQTIIQTTSHPTPPPHPPYPIPILGILHKQYLHWISLYIVNVNNKLDVVNKASVILCYDLVRSEHGDWHQYTTDVRLGSSQPALSYQWPLSPTACVNSGHPVCDHLSCYWSTPSTTMVNKQT